MLTHRNRATTTAAAAVLATVIALLAVIAYQGAAAAQGQPPPAPQNPMAHLIAGGGQEPQVRVSWDAPAQGTAASHTVNRNDGQSFSAPGGATTHSDRTIVPGTAYSYTVTAGNAAGSSPASAPATVSVPPAPSAPGDFAGSVAEITAADAAPTITLTWTASTVPEAAACETAYPLTGYTIVRSGGDRETELGTADAGATSFTDSTAAFSTDYTYRVIAQSAIGASPASETPVNVFSQPVLPPTGLSASISDTFDGSISLSWIAPTEGADITGYLVLRYLGADPLRGTDIPVILDELTTGTMLVDSTPEVGVTYSYMVMARSADNVSLPSNTASIEAPAAPSGLTATAGDGAIDLSWPAPAGTAGSYRTERQEQNGAWQYLADTTGNTHSDTTAQGNTQYFYRVQHRNAHGSSAWTQSDPVTLVLVPGSATGLTAAASGNNNVLTWTAPDSPFIDGYRVRHRSGGGEWSILASDLAGNAAVYTHQDALADMTHHYAVQAHNSAGDGPWSDTASTGRITPPLAPSGVTAALEDDDIVLTWTRPNSVHVSGYTVRHRAGTATDYTESELLPESQTSYRLADPTGDVTHHLGVKAHNDGGESEWSGDVEIVRLLPPAEPTGVTAAADDVNIVVSWTAPARGRVDGYHVGYGDSASEEWQTANVDAAATTFTHGDSQEGVTYRYRVRAHNSAGNGPWSTTETATRMLVPKTPTGVGAEVSGSAILITWTAPGSGIVASYEVEYGVTGSTTPETSSVDAPETLFVHQDPQGDTEYEYRVRSVNQAGSSEWSAAARAMRVVPPPPPTGVTTAISGDDLLVSWTAPASGIIGHYEVERRELGLETWTREPVAAESTSYTHTGPTPGATYEYRVRSANEGGFSSWTETVSDVWYQGAAPPSRIYIQPLGEQLYIRWTESATENVTDYELRYRVDGGAWTRQGLTGRYHLTSWSTEDTLHEYSIRALIDDTTGDWSPINRVTIALPTAVPNVRANRESTNGVRLHWDQPSSGTPAFYRIQASRADGSYYKAGSASAHSSTYLVTHQADDSTVDYRVLAANHVQLTGPAGPDSTVSATMPAPPRQFSELPSGLEITMTDRETVHLTWKAPETNSSQIYSYRIYRKEVSDSRKIGDSYTDHVVVPFSGNTSAGYIDYTAQPGVAYEYAVAAQRNGQNPPTGGISTARAYAMPW